MNQIFVDGHGLCEVWGLPKVSSKKQRKGKYIGESFVHPAKMDVVLCRKIIETYTKLGEVVLDPMSGIGTTLVEASLMGRDAIGVELEQPFVDTTKKNIKLIERKLTLTPKGRAVVIKGDSRELSKILGSKADAAVFSPPYVSTTPFQDTEFMKRTAHDQAEKAKKGETRGHYATPEARIRQFEKVERGRIENPKNISNLKYGKPVDAIVTSPPFKTSNEGGGLNKNPPKTFRGVLKKHSFKLSNNPKNVDNLPYGVDAVITSPPYSESMTKRRKGYTTHPQLSKTRHMGADSSDENIANLPMGKVDSIITSPPYEESMSPRRHKGKGGILERDKKLGLTGQYDIREDSTNIGNQKGETYLQAMLQIYRECYKTLKPLGKIILVLKDFVRAKKVVRLDLDTKKLVESCGFRWVETKLFKLSSKSFWRTLYEKKYPEVDTSLLKYEFVEVFEKPLEAYSL